MCVCVCARACVHVRISHCVCACMCVCVRTRVCVHVCVSMHPCAFVHSCLDTFVSFLLRYAIVYEKGYQDTDLVTSGVTAKLKGVAYTDLNSDPAIGERIWDMADYHIPPQVRTAWHVEVMLAVNWIQETYYRT